MLHLAWLLTVFLVLTKIMQYIVLNGAQPTRDTPLLGVATGQADEQNQISWIIASVVGWVLSVLLIVLLAILPYLIAYLSRNIPRSIVRHTSFKISLRALYFTKLSLVAAAIASSVVLLYSPSSTYQSNTGFFIVLGASFLATVFFSFQYKLTTLWRIPERSVY